MFRLVWLAIKDLSDELFVLIAVNFLYVLINLPLLGLGLVFLGSGALFYATIFLFLSALTLGPTNAGLFTVAQRVTEGRAVKVRLFFEGLREHYQLGWKVYGLWMAGLLLILINSQFYVRMGSTVGLVLTIVFLDLLLIWFGMLIYIGPLMILQEDKSLRIIARNALLMTLGRPIFSLVTLVLMTAITALSVAITLPPFIITFAFLAVWGMRATLKLAADARERQEAQEQKGAVKTTEEGRGGQIRPK
ncbi:MAG TPA: hypothetical protein VFT66_12890 [Roseiflexaceae bacterium]|jgi:hypothetical protein|nr:hypothetical protein [Roseiflexaceae bacterium]